MIAIDTNILVRVVTNDDSVQTQRAAALLKNNLIFISKTVILELDWVLRYVYKLEKSIIYKTIDNLLRTENFVIEQESIVKQALYWYKHGMDFADALHLAFAVEINASKFFSFDQKLVKKAKQLSLKNLEIL